MLLEYFVIAFLVAVLCVAIAVARSAYWKGVQDGYKYATDNLPWEDRQVLGGYIRKRGLVKEQPVPPPLRVESFGTMWD